MGAELMATFKNGIAYEFIKGDTLDPETVASPQIYPMAGFIFRQEAMQKGRPRSGERGGGSTQRGVRKAT